MDVDAALLLLLSLTDGDNDDDERAIFPTSLGSVTTSAILEKENMTSETGESGVARPWLIQERRLPNVTRPTRRFDEVGDAVLEEAARTGSWSKPFSRMVSMASEQWVLAVTVVMGLRRRVRTVALPKGDLSADWDMESRRRWEGVFVGDGGLVDGGVGGSRSLAASQSSSANYSSPVSLYYSREYGC